MTVPIELSFGGLGLCLNLVEPPQIDEEFTPFLTSGGVVDITVNYEIQENLESPVVELTADGRQVDVWYSAAHAHRFQALRGCFMHIPMKELLLMHQRFFLHSSVVDTPWGGILFSGDSGAGKSTQAELWKQSGDGRILNGDRAILAKSEDGWRAYGSPYVGSSKYYVQGSTPVKAIVFPQKSSENKLFRMPQGEAFRKLFLQISLDHTQTEQVEMLVELLAELVETVPVYRLDCTLDQRAVEALREVLKKGESGNDAT